MVKKCCINNCNGNYNEQNKVTVFRLPKNLDERQRWLAAIPRGNVPDGKDTVVCERHWPEHYPTYKHYGKLRPLNPPSVFTCVMTSLIQSTSLISRHAMKSPSHPCNQENESLSYLE